MRGNSGGMVLFFVMLLVQKAIILAGRPLQPTRETTR
jgi:hypothetical protein